VTLLVFALLTPEKIFGLPTPTAISAISGTQAPLFFVYTPTVTPPIIEFPDLYTGETPVRVKGRVNAPDSALRVYAGPGYDFPLLGDLNNKVEVDVIGKSQGGWLYVSYSSPGSELTGWVVDKYVLIEEDDLNKISFVQIVTPTAPSVLP
jgi:hypothetical protein